MGERPRVSIVTPCLNQAAFIPWTVRSVLGQAYPDLEYIVMDGGSTDGTLEALEGFRDRLTLVSEADDGFADAIHRGLQRASGDVVGWLNSDDMLAPGTLDFVADFFAGHADTDLVYSHRCRIDERNIVRGYWILPPHSNAAMLLCAMIPQETCFWRRALLQRAGSVDPTFRFAADHELLVRYMRRGARFHRADRCLAAFRQHRGSKTFREYATVGRDELDRIARRHDLPRGPAARWRARRFKERVRLRSAWHALTRRRLPGAQPGVGWDYAGMWGEEIAGSER